MNSINFKVRINLTVLILAPAILVIVFSCCSSNQSQSEDKYNNTPPKQNTFSIVTPKTNDIVRLGNSFNLKLSSKKQIVPDSVVVFEKNKRISLTKISDINFTCSPETKLAGRKNLEVKVYHSDTLSETLRLNITMLPTDEPKKLNYKLLRTIKHDAEAYTQGLFYHNGFLYESTGQPNRSSIRCVDPKTGDVLRKRKLEPQYFGEGIALIGNEIYMLTYRDRKGFVFNLQDFEIIREFSLQTEEGWGLTTDGKKLIMSDGSAYIYYFSPEYFTFENQVEICSNQRLINNINEMEFTPDGLYANIYGENNIVLINLETGVVTHALDLSGLFPQNVAKDMDHVLNGIAYNNVSKTFYVTGKQWPVMYEISITSK